MMEWLDSLWAWVMSILASFLSLFTSVDPPLMEGAVASDAPSKTSEVLEAFAAQAAQVPPMLVELAEEASDAPPNM